MTFKHYRETRQNANCDGAGPHVRGAVRVLPVGGGGNMIVCNACFMREMAFRIERNTQLGTAARFDVPAWESLKVYGLD